LGPEADQYIDLTVEGALRMDQLLKDLRSFAQVAMEGGESEEEVDAGAALDKAMENVAGLIRESGACITRSPLPALRIHEFQLEQLFQNLIGNSVRYRSEASPRIHVAAELLDQEWVLSVADNGIGIEPQFKEQIFGMFKRLHSTAEYPGTGMGLAICRRIVDRIGGRIWVESEPGKGATFFFTVPRRPK
jgi:light-regulated signal transduction histidine kinase (bacteriophytochrome)